MLQLQVDFSLLNKFFGISLSKISQYANKDIEEIMEIEAQQGNTKAENYKEILSDPDKLYDIFKLSNTENKYIILQNMSEEDLDNLLPLLKQEDLLLGLNYFTDEKIMSMCEELPIEVLSAMVLEKFSVINVLSLMSENSMNSFLKEPDVDRQYCENYFKNMNGDDFKKLMAQYLGPEFEEKSQKESLEYLSNLDDSKYQQFLLSFERNDKINLINGIVSQDEDLIYLFENSDMIAPMNLLEKPDKIKMMGNLEKEFLVPMIKELPVDLTQIVLTQIDSREFSKVLARDFQDILSSVVLFSNKMC